MSYKPAIENPAYPSGKGPVVMVDEGHFNFHTIGNRYRPFAELLRRDGYIVEPLRSNFSKNSLSACQILVISNALHESNQDPKDWCLPTPSAFSEQEITAVQNWVRDGGSLFLIADHMPWPGAAADLALAFGMRFSNCYAYKTQQGEMIREPITFRRSDGSLVNHPITNGRTTGEKVNSVVTFGGQAFQSDANAQPLLIHGESVVSFMVECHPGLTGNQFPPDTPRIPAAGWYQGAVMPFGKGRAAFFGEAAMFSAQISSAGNPMGMNAPGAEQNFQFLLNVMHWLSGLLDNAVSTEPVDRLATTWGSIKYSR